MNGSKDAQALSAWVSAVVRELGLNDGVEDGAIVDMVLDLTADVAHGVSRPGAPVTAFLVGMAAGRSDDPAGAARAYAATISKLADGWAPNS